MTTLNTLKVIHWKNFSFFYIETAAETWWAISSFLKLWNIQMSPTKFLQKFSFSSWPTRKLEEFEKKKSVLPKQTLFISKENAQELVTSFWHKREDFNEEELVFFLQQLSTPHGDLVTKTVRSVNLTKNQEMNQLPEIKKNEIPEIEKTLIGLTQQALEIAKLAQDSIHKKQEKSLNLLDCELLANQVHLLEEYVLQLKEYSFKESAEEPNFIDIDFQVYE
jgi:hypothetical protein